MERMKISEVAIRNSLKNNEWIIKKSADFAVLYAKMNWTWVTSETPDKVPDFEEIRETIVHLIIDMIKNEKDEPDVTSMGSGGIYVERGEDGKLYVKLIADEFEVP